MFGFVWDFYIQGENVPSPTCPNVRGFSGGLFVFQMTTRKIKILVISFTLLISFASCKRLSSNTNANQIEPMREVVDGANRKIQIPVKLTRVISLSPYITEIIFAVGGESKLAGVSAYCDYPAKAKEIAQVGDIIQPDINRIIELKPQLIFVYRSEQTENFRERMEAAKIPYYVTDPHNMEEVFRTMLTVGDLLEQKPDAEKLIGDLRTRVAEIENKVKDKPPVPVFYQLSPQPIFAAGRDSYITDMIRIAGGQSVTANIPEASPQIKDGANFLAQPEAIIIPASGAAMKKKLDVAPFLQDTPAVKNNRVYGINDYLLARPGPRIVDGLEELVRVLQPEAFK